MRQREQEGTTTTISNEDYNTTNKRQVGMKSKRDEDYEGDDVKWEEAPPTGKTLFCYNLIHLQVQNVDDKKIHSLCSNNQDNFGYDYNVNFSNTDHCSMFCNM